MSGVEERVERLTKQIEELRKTLAAHTALLTKYSTYLASLTKYKYEAQEPRRRGLGLVSMSM